MRFGTITSRSGFSEAYVEYYICDNLHNQLLVASLFHRSEAELRSVTANMGKMISFSAGIREMKYQVPDDREIYYAPVNMGYEKFCHALMLSKDKRYMFSENNRTSVEQHLHDYLMKNFDLFIPKEWISPIMDELQKHCQMQLVSEVNVSVGGSETIYLYGKHVPLKDVCIYYLNISQTDLDDVVKRLLQEKKIVISRKEQYPLLISDMDSYFAKYGHRIVENLSKKLTPLVPIKGYVEELALYNKKLYPQQAAIVNGLTELLKTSNYAILNEGMGCGKSLQGASTIESYYVKKYLESHPNETVKDAYMSDDKIQYRVVIMAPGHLVEKWANEWRTEIPYAKITILNDFHQLVDIKKKGIKRNGREIYIIGKDFCKLSYSSIPIPTTITKKKAGVIACRRCGKIGEYDSITMHKSCRGCGAKDWKFVEGPDTCKALVCPSCGNLLIAGDNGLMPVDFASMNDINSRCNLCGESLWRPNVKNIGNTLKAKKWKKIRHYRNRAHKGFTTSWVMEGHEAAFCVEKGIEMKYIQDAKESKSRKISPAFYIKRQLKGFFDMAIFDEAHMYKGGDTAQGNAMHSLVKASKKSLALTGTIAGGYANHLFYMLYRLDPGRMKKKGFSYTDIMKFTETYGNIETVFEARVTGYERHNSCSRGKQINSPTAKPGISPLIFSHFLMDKSVFLDLSDMGGYLPALKETVVTVPMDTEIGKEYARCLESLRSMMMDGGVALASVMLQFGLSFPDAPFKFGNILDPRTGEIVLRPKHFSEQVLLPKEEKLIEIVNSELAEKRKLFVYCEYTGEGEANVSKRLKRILEEHCGLKGEVEILESQSPCASDREQWIHKKAKQGIKVFITNPRNVETGLDFIFEHEGTVYNYPTIIFYQMGYNLFTLWQASRRHFRLNQILECRTYYFAYEKTVQETALTVMGEKQVATSAIQGKFSAEGLSAMAVGVDARLKMVQALANDAFESNEKIQQLFDQQNTMLEDETYTEFKEHKVLTFTELTGIACQNSMVDFHGTTEETESYDLFTFLSFMNSEKVSKSESETKDAPEKSETKTGTPKKEPKSRTRRRNEIDIEETDLFKAFLELM